MIAKFSFFHTVRWKQEKLFFLPPLMRMNKTEIKSSTWNNDVHILVPTFRWYLTSFLKVIGIHFQNEHVLPLFQRSKILYISVSGNFYLDKIRAAKIHQKIWVHKWLFEFELQVGTISKVTGVANLFQFSALSSKMSAVCL